MENASKALIIAGAILISILLISVGIIVMNSINEPIDQAADTAESQAIEMFNAKFTPYMGEIDYNSYKSFLTMLNSINGSSEVKGKADRKITIPAVTLQKGKTYTVTVSDTKPTSAPDGYYDTVAVSVK